MDDYSYEIVSIWAYLSFQSDSSSYIEMFKILFISIYRLIFINLLSDMIKK